MRLEEKTLEPYLGWNIIYNLARWIGVGLGAWYFYRALYQTPPIRKPHLALFILVGSLVALFGGSVLPYFYKKLTLEFPVSFMNAGRYVHSTFAFTLLYVILASRKLGWPTRKIMDIYAIAGMLMSGIGRIGCHFQGCCMGKPTTLPWAIDFHKYPWVPVHPAQLYMLGAELGLFGFLWWFNKRKQYDGQTFWLSIWLYAIYRFLIEIVRTNPPVVAGLTHAQLFSVFGGIFSTIVLLYYRLHPPTTPSDLNRR